jgi:GTP-binding protein
MDDEFSSDEIAAGTRLLAQPWTFLKGVVGLEHLPPADRPEIAFAGRSNVGKSSLINALTGQNHLARTSNTPGRTQEINFFRCDTVRMYVVDMPGYGFAEAPKDKVDAWNGLVRDYLRGRATLARVLLLIDARHGLKPVDREVMGLLDTAAVAYQIVLTKADKISVPALAKLVEATESSLTKHPAAMPVPLATSSTKSRGIDRLRAAISRIYRDFGPDRAADGGQTLRG